jgi:hypothetical protein
MDTFYRNSQRTAMREERDTAVRQINHPNFEDKAGLQKRIRRIDQNLERGTPPELNAEQRDKANVRRKFLEEEITRDMPSDTEMRRNDRGSVGRHLAWHEAHKHQVSEWKNIKMALEPQNEDPDLCNVETLRSLTRTGDPSFSEAQIPGRLFVGTNPSPAYKAGWDQTFGDADEAPPEVVKAPARPPAPRNSIVNMNLDAKQAEDEAQLTD